MALSFKFPMILYSKQSLYVLTQTEKPHDISDNLLIKEKNSLSNRMSGKTGNTNYPNIALANAWVDKLQQAYNKAKVSFPGEPLFI